MKKIILKTVTVLIIILVILGVNANNDDFLYRYKLGADGEYGVMIHQLATRNYAVESEGPRLKTPGIPGVRDDHMGNGNWQDGLPIGQQEIVWQLAELSDCKHILEVKSRDQRFSGSYTRKADYCKWNPLPTIYRQTIDFDQIRQSPEYQAATKFRWDILDNSKYGVQILFAFKDTEVTMHLNYFKTNPWK
jgi:hypothetical protein